MVRVVEIQGPADFDFVRIVRLVTISLASQEGLPADPCEELRSAVDAAANALIDGEADQLHVSFVVDDATLTATVRSLRTLSDFRLDQRTVLVLAALADNFFVLPGGSVVIERRLR